jgi:hypothetical protein
MNARVPQCQTQRGSCAGEFDKSGVLVCYPFPFSSSLFTERFQFSESFLLDMVSPMKALLRIAWMSLVTYVTVAVAVSIPLVWPFLCHEFPIESDTDIGSLVVLVRPQLHLVGQHRGYKPLARKPIFGVDNIRHV